MRNFYAETGRAAAKTLYNALTPFLSGIAAFSLKKPLLFATAFLFFAFIAAPAAGQAPSVSYAGPQIYSLGAAIAPLTPTSSGVASVGSGTGYGTPATTSTSLSSPQDIAVDAAGNIYVTSQPGIKLMEFPAGGGSPIDLSSGFSSPVGITVDALGSIYVADAGDNTLKRIPYYSTGTVIKLASNLNSPAGVAVDAALNVYVSEAGSGKVYEISYTG